MSNLRPESRIKSLEKRATDREAAIEELSSDQTEELKAIRQDIKQLDEGITASYKSIGDTFIAFGNDLETVKQDIATIKATMTTKDDIARLEDLIKQLLQQKPEGQP
ncbi:MAG TPA: hypothetical protein VGL94_17680 [Ktedonobacteraceae bacterium]|jgi:uncharacterized coiled-coil protein SlyX